MFLPILPHPGSRQVLVSAGLIVALALPGCGDDPAAPTPVTPPVGLQPSAPTPVISPFGLQISAGTIPFDSLELVRDGRIGLVATLIAEDVQLLNPVNLVWTSGEPQVAAIDGNGVVTAVSEGTTKIFATAADQVDTVVVTVTTVEFVSLSGSGGTFCGLNGEGKAYCWGQNTGNAVLPASGFPVPVDGGLSFSDIDVGNWVTSEQSIAACGVTTNGEIYCWNTDGPERVESQLTFTSVSAGWGHACALTTAGKIYCWGVNLYGQLGDGTTIDRATPTPTIAGDHVFVEVSAASDHTCALTNLGEAYCWGQNSYGQVGTGSNEPGEITTPVRAAAAYQFKRIAVGFHDFSCGMTLADELLCWAHNDLAQLGRGFTSNYELDPAPPAGLPLASDVDGDAYHACAVDPSGAGYCWSAWGGKGELGDGNSTASMVPVQVVGSLQFQTIQTASSSSCGLTPDGLVYCWGWNLLYEPDERSHPEPVLLLGSS